MQLLILRRIVKVLAFYLFFVAIAFAQKSEISEYFDKAQSGSISITELVDFLVIQAIKSPITGPEVGRYKQKISSFTETATPILISKILSLIADGKTEEAWAIKTLTDNIIPNTWPESIRLIQIFDFLDKIENIKQKNDIRSLSILNFTRYSKEDAAILENITQKIAKNFMEQALDDADSFSGLKKMAELSAAFPNLPLKENAKFLVNKLAQDANLDNWSLDNPTVQQFIVDIFVDNSVSLYQLYKRKILATLPNENRASIYYSFFLPYISEEQKIDFKKAILEYGIKNGLDNFTISRIKELEEAKSISFFQKIMLAFRGYYGKAILIVPLFVILFPLSLLFKKLFSRKKSSIPKSAVSEDEYTRLLKKLNLEEDASEAQIKKAFRQMVKEHHPDAHGAKGVVLDKDGKVDQKFEELRKTYDRIMEIRKSWFGAR